MTVKKNGVIDLRNERSQRKNRGTHNKRKLPEKADIGKKTNSLKPQKGTVISGNDKKGIVEGKTNRKYKDSVFVDLFYEDETSKKNLLSL